ncbi:MAG: hypothetical protein O3A46_05930, partial [Candidatus Poribacteria bacterium]|nr:hypothetical protein [Candidatus Poribacteria bacterium]
MNVLMRVACIVVLVTVGCAGASPTVGIQDRSSYPSWFWQLPEADVAVGVASYGTYEDSTLREAVADAARNLARRERVVIAGGRGEILHVGGATLFADFEETYSAERATAFAEPDNVLAVARSGTMVVVLLASRSPSDAEKARYSVDPGGAPDEMPGWIASPPIRDGYLYAVG